MQFCTFQSSNVLNIYIKIQNQLFKIEALNNLSYTHNIEIDILVAEKETAVTIHTRSSSVYENVAVNES